MLQFLRIADPSASVAAPTAADAGGSQAPATATLLLLGICLGWSIALADMAAGVAIALVWLPW